MAKRRLDTLLTERGLFPSRSRAAASVMAGEVRVGPGRRLAEKPGEMVDPAEPLSIAERPAFVSRGGIKLANALSSEHGFDDHAAGQQVAGLQTGDGDDGNQCISQRVAEHNGPPG